MKNPAPLLALSLLCLAPVSARADITINLDAGQLTSALGLPMQAGPTMSSTNGSLLLLIDTGANNTLANSVAGSYVSGNNTILAAGDFNTFFGTNETDNQFDISGSPAVGDDIALRWFPQITLAQFEAGALPTVGEFYGTYDPNGGNPDGNATWTVPAGGATETLDFYTTNSEGGGTQAPSEGMANSLVGLNGVAVVPEPSSYAMLGLGVLALVAIRRFRAVGAKV